MTHAVGDLVLYLPRSRNEGPEAVGIITGENKHSAYRNRWQVEWSDGQLSSETDEDISRFKENLKERK